MSSIRLARRRFLALSAAGLGGSLLSGCDRLSETPEIQEFLSSTEELNYRIQRLLGGRHALAREFTARDVSSVFKVNGSRMPEGEDYAALLENNFANWRLRVDGLVANTLDLSLAELLTMPQRPRSPAMTASKAGAPSANGRVFRWRLCCNARPFFPPPASLSSTAPAFLNKRSTVPDNIMKASISSTHSIRKPFLRTVSMASR